MDNGAPSRNTVDDTELTVERGGCLSPIWRGADYGGSKRTDTLPYIVCGSSICVSISKSESSHKNTT